MKVLHVIARMNTGGTAQYVDELVSGLKIHGIDVLLATGSVSNLEVEHTLRSEVPVRRITKLGRAIRPLDDLRALRELGALVKSLSPDIVHSHTFKAGALMRLLPGPARKVHTFHGSSLSDPEFQGLATAGILGVERILFRRTDAAVAVSDQLARELTCGGIGSEGRFTIIPPGVRHLATVERREARAALNLPKDATVVAWLARFAPVKGPERVLALATRFPDTIFLMAGGGVLWDTVAATAPPNVRVLSWSDPGLIYGAADIALMTSHSEGFGISLVEAQLAGLPVVATDVGGVAEAVLVGKTGFVAPARDLGDLLERLILDAGLRAHLGSAGAAFATVRFSPELMVQRHIELYSRLIRMSGSSS